MRFSVRGSLGVALLIGLGLVLVACGEKKDAEVVAVSESSAPQEVEKPVQASAATGYAIPEALTPKESKKLYGLGKLRAAKKKNSAALKLRKKKNTEGAIAAYRTALELSPGYVTARFNLACEYARFGNADEAIAELDHLFKMGTPEALRKIAKLQVDSDFDPIRTDPRIKQIEEHFAIDFEQPLFKQICANEGKIIGIMDHEAGLYGISTRVDNNEGVVRGKSSIVKGGKARVLVFKLLDTLCDMGKVARDERAEGPVLSDTKLSEWVEKYPKRCITYYANLPGDPEVDGDGHGTDIEGAMCFIRQGQRWTLGVAGEWEVDGGMETDVKPAVDKATKKAVAAWGS